MFHISWKGGTLKMEIIRFEDRRQIWRQSRKKLKIGLFSTISNNESANFHTRPGWKMAEWFALILLKFIPYTLKGGWRLKIDTIQFVDWRQIWPQSHKNSKFDYFYLFQSNYISGGSKWTGGPDQTARRSFGGSSDWYSGRESWRDAQGLRYQKKQKSTWAGHHEVSWT